MYRFVISIFFVFILIYVTACSSNKSSSVSPANEATEEQNDEIVESSKEEANTYSNNTPSKPVKIQEIYMPEEKFEIETESSKKQNTIADANISENSEQLSVSSKSAKVILHALNIKKGSYTIGTNKFPYATVYVKLLQGTTVIEGNLESGTVQLQILDSAGITQGTFKGTLHKDDERFVIGGKFSNQ